MSESASSAKVADGSAAPATTPTKVATTTESTGGKSTTNAVSDQSSSSADVKLKSPPRKGSQQYYPNQQQQKFRKFSQQEQRSQPNHASMAGNAPGQGKPLRNQRRGSSYSVSYQQRKYSQNQPQPPWNNGQRFYGGGYPQQHQQQQQQQQAPTPTNDADDQHRRRHSTEAKARKKSDAQQSTGRGSRSGTGRHHSSISESAQNGSGDYDYYTDEYDLEEPFSDSDEETEIEREARRKRQSKPQLYLPMPRRRIRTLSGMIPAIGYSPVWGGPTMCLKCLEFFDLPKQTTDYVQHLLDKHKIVITDIELIVDLKRYIEHWRHRFGQESIETMFPLVVPTEEDPLFGKTDTYFLMSEKLPEDRQVRERLALRRLDEVLCCQQREREDRTFNRQCLFCRYRTKGNRNECIYCEKTFPDHQTLSEHMRKKQHREVNPKNSYYDKFYVINYLELGKKWLEVLAEDFEDNMPAFMDSDEEEEEETWHEWQEEVGEDGDISYVCLFCDEAFQETNALLSHMKEKHDYDLKEVIINDKLEFYDRVKFVNYIRKLSHNCVCFICGKDDLRSWPALRHHLADLDHLKTKVEREKWDQETYLIPTYENDSLLLVLDGMFGLPEDEEEQCELPTTGRKCSTNDICSGEAGTVSETSPRLIIPEDLPDLEDTVLKDAELREQLM